MKLKSSSIFVNDLRLYAHHGVMEQEQRVGTWFVVTLRVHYYIMRAMKSDDIKDALSYADIVGVVKEEMAKPSRLLEHVAGRIAETILERFPQAQSIELKLTKENPPMGVDCSGAGVEIRCKRDADSDLVNNED
ncbi:MAG: dihydroneopterin aldolase [Prevotella sp.]|nr:dihydroneopterin aldolase [Prevotella sp.]